MARVELENITKSFRDRRCEVAAVDRVCLAIHDGEFLVVVGPSGCGKTTTLRLVAGLEELSAGDIRIGDRIVNRVLPKDRDVAMVFQNYALYPHLSVYDNMAFGLKVRGTPKTDIQRKVTEVARRLSIEPLLRRKPEALSGGEQQRVALARAIVRRPKVFLFDEPLSNLDVSLRVQMRSEIKTLHRELGITTLHVTHDQEEAMILGDRIAVMKGGRLQQCAPPTEVYERPVNLFVAGFIGSPPMNFLRGRLYFDGSNRCFESPLGRFTMPPLRQDGLASPTPAAHNGEVVLGLRPEHIFLDCGGLQPALTRSVGDDPERRNGAISLPASVRAIEPLGDRMHIRFRLASGEDIVARVSSDTPISIAESVTLRLDLTRAHLFDSATTE